MLEPLERSSPQNADRHRLAWAAWPADLYSPVRLFLALRASGHAPCLLESAEGPARLARYSFLPVDPDARLTGQADGGELETDAGVEKLPGPSHLALRAAAKRFALPPTPRGLPPFCGGWVGWIGYEWARSLEPRVPAPRHDPWQTPEAAFHLYRTVVAFDHAAQKVLVITACPDGASGHAAAMQKIEALAADLETEPGAPGELRLLDAEPLPCMERAAFEAGVETLQEAIRAGEIFQGVLSQRFEQRFEGDPFTLYRVLRLTNPSPHMFFFEGGGVTLVGSSPERLVSVQDGRCQGRP
ncbi:MAG TPA: chorismate-binding protein, partial [Planctomycetota bacterium]